MCLTQYEIKHIRGAVVRAITAGDLSKKKPARIYSMLNAEVAVSKCDFSPNPWAFRAEDIHSLEGNKE